MVRRQLPFLAHCPSFLSHCQERGTNSKDGDIKNGAYEAPSTCQAGCGDTGEALTRAKLFGAVSKGLKEEEDVSRKGVGRFFQAKMAANCSCGTVTMTGASVTGVSEVLQSPEEQQPPWGPRKAAMQASHHLA